MIEFHRDALFLHILRSYTRRLVKFLCFINDGLANLNGIALKAECFRIILVDQVRENQVVDQTRQRLPRNVLNRKKRIGHVLSPLICSC